MEIETDRQTGDRDRRQAEGTLRVRRGIPTPSPSFDTVVVRHGVTSSARTWMDQRGEKREMRNEKKETMHA